MKTLVLVVAHSGWISAALVEYSVNGWALQNSEGEARYPTFRVLTFCSHQKELTGIERDRKGLTEIEFVGVLGKDLVFVGWFVALSRRRQGFETPWDCQLPEPVSGLSPHILPLDFSPAFLPHPPGRGYTVAQVLGSEF
jgi:hypothetical protein